MNRLIQLQQFYRVIVTDARISPTHICLYMALFQKWQLNGFGSPFSCNRREVMELSKISSRATYHKALKDLVAYGYIDYEPSFNPDVPSRIYIKPLEGKVFQA